MSLQKPESQPMPKSMSRRPGRLPVRGRGLLIGLLGVASLTGCRTDLPVEAVESAPLPAVPVRSFGVLLDFEAGAAAVGGILPNVENAGTWELESRVVTLNGGRVRRDLGVDGGFAARFPAVQVGSTHPQAAAIIIRPIGDEPLLNPGTRDFRFGADFRLDQVSDDGAADNGDNLVQWGLFSDAAQYKVQIDHGRPSCRIAGDAGEAVVKAEESIVPGRWYRVSCERRSGRVLLELQELEHSSSELSVWSVEAATGDLGEASPDQAMSVGGKISAAGRITASSTDQFNGAVDNVLLELID